MANARGVAIVVAQIVVAREVEDWSLIYCLLCNVRPYRVSTVLRAHVKCPIRDAPLIVPRVPLIPSNR
jgi:hypothetical protein